MSISVVILNFSRPEYILNNILPVLQKNKHIDEILISHGKEKTAFASPSKKVKTFNHWDDDHNGDYGLALRFLTGTMAKNDKVIIMDDDIVPSQTSIDFLNKKITEDPARVYGIYGRCLDTKNEYSYTNYFGEVDVVLTRFLITTKSMCEYFIDNFRDYETDLVKNSKPYWNGEDILFSFLSFSLYRKHPIAFDLSHTNRVLNYLNLSESISIGGDHDNYRKKLSRELVESLKISKTGTKNKYWKTQVRYFVENSSLFSFLIFLFLAMTIYKFYFSTKQK